jgi:predicted ChrR family anti-sigma factor
MTQEEVRESLASGYAAGSLDAALRLLVDAQSAVAPSGRQIVPLGHPFIAPHTTLPAPAAQSLTEELSALPAVIQDAAIRALAHRQWQAPVSGLKMLSLDVNSRAEANLLRIAPRSATPRHTHEELEYALVLSGELDDGVGRYTVGEVSVADASVIHTPRAGSGDVLWLLVVRYGRLRLTGMLGVVQRLLRR